MNVLGHSIHYEIYYLKSYGAEILSVLLPHRKLEEEDAVPLCK